MKFIGIIGAIVYCTAVADVNGQGGGCSRIAVRRDIQTLSPQEWDRISGVLQRMHNDGWIDRFASMHNQEFRNIHGNENFFPFHRLMLREFEEIGQRYDPEFALPYWDELRDSRNPAGSGVMTGRLVGGNGHGGCVPDGLERGWQLSFPNRHCLVRNYDRGNQMNSWYSPEYVYSVMQRNNNMRGIREGIEFSIHGSVHLSVGGDMATMWSPTDFIFYLHHANLDRLWMQWQSWGHQWTMDGRSHTGGPISLSSPLPHYGDSVGSTMQLGTNRMCFTYAGGSGQRRGQKLGRELALASISSGYEVNEAEINLRNLPLNLQMRWFPTTAKKPQRETSSNIGSTGSRGLLNNIVVQNGTNLVYPAPLTEKWIQMHGFDRRRVAQAMAEAREFVDSLNAAGYKSPF